MTKEWNTNYSEAAMLRSLKLSAVAALTAAASLSTGSLAEIGSVTVGNAVGGEGIAS